MAIEISGKYRGMVLTLDEKAKEKCRLEIENELEHQVLIQV